MKNEILSFLFGCAFIGLLTLAVKCTKYICSHRRATDAPGDELKNAADRADAIAGRIDNAQTAVSDSLGIIQEIRKQTK